MQNIKLSFLSKIKKLFFTFLKDLNNLLNEIEKMDKEYDNDGYYGDSTYDRRKN